MEIKTNENTAYLRIDSSIYGEECIFNTLYWLNADFEVVIRKDDGRFYDITLTQLVSSQPLNWQDVFTKIKQDLIDNQLRNIVNRETKAIRELIIAKAFSYYDIPEQQVDQVSDPVGFDPKTI